MAFSSSTASSESSALTDSRLAALCAGTVQRAFLDYDEQFHGITLIAQSSRWEIAESFFNSLTRRVFATEGVDQAIEFVATDFDEAPTKTPADIRRIYSGGSIHELLIASLTDPAAGFAEEHWDALDATARVAGERIQSAFRASPGRTPGNESLILEIIGNVFYRGRGAYLVGRAFRDSDDRSPLAIALCLRHENETGIDFDAILIGETDLAILFSFTRAYFRVDTECPYELVRSLSELMPRKRLIDLYNAIGYHRHGKTEFYRDFVRHLRSSRDRFAPALLDDLLRDAGSIVRLEGDDVMIAHAYVERRIRPLNLFLFEAGDAAVAAAARDYGRAIKDLAASNIFPGDIFTKNFGVTRHGRVVFYDYDELCFMTDCNFRDMPQPTTHEEEISAEPWFSVRQNDIFPEEFPNFLHLPESAWTELLKHHGDLFRPEFWRAVQERLRAGEIPEVFPYPPERRLASA